jgi:hypothetical protein
MKENNEKNRENIKNREKEKHGRKIIEEKIKPTKL